MTRRISATIIVLTSLFVAPAYSQPADKAQARPAGLDPAAIRREAAKLAELRALLADPDPNVRLLTIREVARNGDAAQRQLAIEAGVSSAESIVQEAALRAMFANVQQIVLQLAPSEGKSASGDERTNLTFTVEKFDPETGRISGRNYNSWSGQIQGSTFAFSANSGTWSGSLIWDAEAGEYRGTVNTDNGRASGMRKASWRPR